ncbi:MAG: hypothetical protein IJF39_03310 [Clostridia bacterium]|nr:hypothetical protein [Clostridia bacterium]
MKNLFDYATKELSQDAFLRWLFENYNCKNEKVRQVCRRLFNKFTSDELDFSKIENLTTMAQWKYIDISIWFTIDNKKYLIVIEDKTTSEEHWQLSNYNKKIEEHNRWLIGNKENPIEKVYKVFYKTAEILKEEKDRIKEAQWLNIFDIKEIHSIFSDIAPTNSEVLDYYIEHIKKTYQALFDYQSKPVYEWSKTYAVFTMYSKRLIEKYSTKINEKCCRTEIYQGRYAQTFLQKNLPNNATVELGLIFREWECTAWIKIWDTDCGWRTLFSRKEELKNLSFENPRLSWENKKYKNRIRIIKKSFTENLTYEEFNAWIENCIKDYLDFAKKVAMIPKMGQ